MAWRIPVHSDHRGNTDSRWIGLKGPNKTDISAAATWICG